MVLDFSSGRRLITICTGVVLVPPYATPLDALARARFVFSGFGTFFTWMGSNADCSMIYTSRPENTKNHRLIISRPGMTSWSWFSMISISMAACSLLCGDNMHINIDRVLCPQIDMNGSQREKKLQYETVANVDRRHRRDVVV